MKSSFSKTLSSLRRKTGLSQRQAAAELGISQALLSHYENGAREPKLDFVVRVCDYYDITADYLLGRADEWASQGLPAPHGCEGAPRLISASRTAFGALDEFADQETYAAAVDYLIIPAENVAAMLRDPDAPSDPMRDADLKLAEAAFVTNVRRVRNGGGQRREASG